MVSSNSTKYIYRDVRTGRLLHKRQIEQLPAGSWTKEAFVSPMSLEAQLAAGRSGLETAIVVDIRASRKYGRECG